MNLNKAMHKARKTIDDFLRGCYGQELCASPCSGSLASGPSFAYQYLMIDEERVVCHCFFESAILAELPAVRHVRLCCTRVFPHTSVDCLDLGRNIAEVAIILSFLTRLAFRVLAALELVRPVRIAFILKTCT